MADGASDVNSVALPLRVLLVEDHPDLAAATAAFLEAEGLDVRTALSGHEGLAITASFQPQLLLCDVNLPDMSGLDVVRELRSTLSAQRAYIVMLTGLSGMDATQLQVDRCLVKPLTTETISMLVQAARLKTQNNVTTTPD